MAKNFGKCALCRQECELTFEHIPPRAAFNSTPTKPVSGEKLLDDDRMPWDTTGLKYTNQQKGMGRYSLCPKCNNDTGSWYGDDYIIVAQVVHSILSKPIDPKYQGFGIRNIHPLRFIKQVLSMFCSINNFEDERIDTLRRFVTAKDAVGLDKSKYKVCMYLTRSKLMKYAPLSVVIKMKESAFESMALSEITAYPLGFVLYFDPTETFHYDGLDITHFADCRFDDVTDIQMPFCIYEMNDFFPTYYRSKEEIQECIDENRKWTEEYAKNSQT